MKKRKQLLLFTLGGIGYLGIELLWRGWTHPSMFFAGGSCFLLLGKLEQAEPRLPLIPKAVTGAIIITGVELLTGLIINRGYNVWDYRDVPFNFHGQICLPFSLLWIPVSLGGMQLYSLLNKRIAPSQQTKTQNTIIHRPNQAYDEC